VAEASVWVEEAVAPAVPVEATTRLDWLMAGLGGWLVAGFYADLWAHRHGIVDNTFITPWHALLYTGATSFLVVLGLLGVRQLFPGRPTPSAVGAYVRGMLRPPRTGGLPVRALIDAMPAGYRVSFVGSLVFVAAGVIDLAWHTVFGFELDVETLLSPPHLLLATAGVLMASGPLRSIWYRADPVEQGWTHQGPAVASLVLVLCVFNAFTQYANPITHVLASPAAELRSIVDVGMAVPFVREGWGASEILVHAALMAGFALVGLRRRSLPPGALFVLITVPTLAIIPIMDEWRFVPAAVVAGLVAEGLARFVGYGRTRGRDLAVAFALPAQWILLYFVTLRLTTGISWSPTLVVGAIELAGIVGVLLNEVTRSGLGRPAEGL
jgi:hypothetical protein